MFAAVLLFSVAQAILPARFADAELSRHLTSAAEELLRIEKKAAAEQQGLDALLYEDVLSLLDMALRADPQNLHAHALAAGALLLKSYDGDSYDICTLLEARAEAEFVTGHASRAKGDDLAGARAVLHEIALIPPDEIPDSPSSCDEEDERHFGSRSSPAKTR